MSVDSFAQSGAMLAGAVFGPLDGPLQPPPASTEDPVITGLKKELALTQRLLELSEALRHRLQRENEALKGGASPVKQGAPHA